MTIPYVLARLLAGLAEDGARALGVPMVTAVVDQAGALQYFGRMDGALPASIELAVSKAFTAAVLRLPTDEVGELARDGGMIPGIQNTHQGRIILFGGGLPLRLAGRVIGAIGVSGGTVAQDLAVARPVVEAFEQMEKWSRLIEPLLPVQTWDPGYFGWLEEVIYQFSRELKPPLAERAKRILAGAFILSMTD